jgi:hypothetical protein
MKLHFCVFVEKKLSLSATFCKLIISIKKQRAYKLNRRLLTIAYFNLLYDK